MYTLARHIELLKLAYDLKMSGKLLSKEDPQKSSELYSCHYILYNYIGFQERNTLAKILDNFLNKKISKHILKKKIDAIYDRVGKKLQFFEHGPGLNLKRLRHSDIEISLSDDFSEDIIDELYEFVKTKEDEITQVLVFFNEKKLFNEVKSITKDLDVYLD